MSSSHKIDAAVAAVDDAHRGAESEADGALRSSDESRGAGDDAGEVGVVGGAGGAVGGKPPADDARRARRAGCVVCVGDIHGNLRELQQLWAALEAHLGKDGLNSATVIFLGDYCDRGPDTKGVLDWLIALREAREADEHAGETRFIAGNHCFGFAGYLGCLPFGPRAECGGDGAVESPVPPFHLDSTKKASYTTGFWPFPVEPHGMHYQGRRWGGSPTYNAAATFASYGVRFRVDEDARRELIAAVPAAHKQLLMDLEWAVDVATTFKPGRVVAVHAGLQPRVPLRAQLDGLARRDLSCKALFEKGDCGRFAVFSGRGNVLRMHPKLEGKAVLVSGHHGVVSVRKDRVIMDRSGGRPHPKDSPLEAIVLAAGSRTIVGSGTVGPRKAR